MAFLLNLSATSNDKSVFFLFAFFSLIDVAEIKVLFKTLRTDDASDIDDLGWTYFNTTGTTDTPTNSSLTVDDFQQYEYTAGVKDDGTETALDEFISFSIKIVMQGTNSSEPPRIKDLRCIALAT